MSPRKPNPSTEAEPTYTEPLRHFLVQENDAEKRISYKIFTQIGSDCPFYVEAYCDHPHSACDFACEECRDVPSCKKRLERMILDGD